MNVRMMNMITVCLVALTSLVLASCHDADDDEPKTTNGDEWKLVWMDDFDGDGWDPDVWYNEDRYSSNYFETHSGDPRLYEVSNSCLILRSMVNDFLPYDPAPVVCGSIRSLKSFNMVNGKIEIRAKVQNARGCNPSLWLMPVGDQGWPDTGEIDILEYPFANGYAYQTVHTYQTNTVGNTTDPISSVHTHINVNEFNVYSVEVTSDSLTYAINGTRTMTFPRLPDVEKQYPFGADYLWYLKLSAGAGTAKSWQGKANPEDLPSEFQIDWVKYYRKD